MTWPDRLRDFGSWLMGLPWRFQRWLAVRLDYQEISREDAARELLIQSINSGEVAGKSEPTPRPRPSIFALPRKSPTDVLSFSHPELRRRWRV